MASQRLSRLQRHILTWLAAEEQRTRGTMAASHADLVRALAHDTGNVSTSLKGLAAKGLITITRTSGERAEAVDLTAEGRTRVAALTAIAFKTKIFCPGGLKPPGPLLSAGGTTLDSPSASWHTSAGRARRCPGVLGPLACTGKASPLWSRSSRAVRSAAQPARHWATGRPARARCAEHRRAAGRATWDTWRHPASA
jgi:DNA-binding MarR family transcriptional regulator